MRAAQGRAPPALPPGQQLSTLQASHRDLTADCDLAFKTFHDFLDGYFGKAGDQAYAEKAKYAYDRRAGPHKAAKEPVPAHGPAAGATTAGPTA